MMRSPSWPRSARGRSRFASPGSSGLSKTALRDLASRHGIRPRKRLGQHFLADTNLAAAIVREAEVEPGDRVLEVGPGLGSLTVALASAGADVLAVEVDPSLIPALREVAEGYRVRVIEGDAARMNWSEVLDGGRWSMVSNLPYNVAVPVVLGLLAEAPTVDPFVVMVQREVGERLVAGPRDPAYGAVSVRVAFRARARLLRRVPPTVFWPEPRVESILVRLDRRETGFDPGLLTLVDEGFRHRRKTLGSALIRLGHPPARAREALARAGLGERVRAEELGLQDFARLWDAFRG